MSFLFNWQVHWYILSLLKNNKLAKKPKRVSDIAMEKQGSPLKQSLSLFLHHAAVSVLIWFCYM